MLNCNETYLLFLATILVRVWQSAAFNCKNKNSHIFLDNASVIVIIKRLSAHCKGCEQWMEEG